ncbi:MAG TPA: putative 2-dehydropantoate 2-reductase [Tepidisphaeraceae bacterium]|jgi:2-dehydropantoate 2-reductase
MDASSHKPLIAIVGTGAIGAYYGGRLAQHGHDVHFLLRSDYDAVRERGWSVRSCHGDFVLPPSSLHAYDDPTRMPRADLVIVTLKTTANDQFEKLIAPLLKPDTTILTLQNGLGNEERLAELFGARRVLGGMAFVCINRVEPGVVHHIAEGLITLGEFEPIDDQRVHRIARMFTASQIPCRVIDDLRYGRWEKLVWNVPFNGLSAVMDQTTDLLLGSPAGEALVRSLMEEVLAAARGVGVELPRSLIDAKVEQTRGMGAYKTSMHLDMLAGRAMEVQAIFGAPVRAAQEAGVSVPRLEMLYRMLKLRDAAPRVIGPEAGSAVR